MTRYIILAIDRTLESRPRRLWIYDNKEECMKNFDFLCQNPDWTIPEYMEVEEIILNGECL